jgi:hypothetical protein
MSKLMGCVLNIELDLNIVIHFVLYIDFSVDNQ